MLNSSGNDDNNLDSQGAALHRQQCDIDRLLHEADIRQFEMTAIPQGWVARYYRPENMGDQDASRTPRGSRKHEQKDDPETHKKPKRAQGVFSVPSPRVHRLRDEAVAKGPDASLGCGSAAVDAAAECKRGPQTTHPPPTTKAVSPANIGQLTLWVPLEDSIISPAVTASKEVLETADAETQTRWRALAARRQAAALFTDDLEYRAKEFMRRTGGDDPPAFVFPLDDDVVKIFGGSSMIAKEVFERAGSVHYATINGAETLVMEEMDRRKAEVAARVQDDASASPGVPDNGLVDDDMWFAIPRVSPVHVQKIVGTLRQLIAAHLKEAETVLREECA
jgi:hypothetical protein